MTAPGDSPHAVDDVPISAPVDPIEGSLITRSFGYDGGRRVTAYMPPRAPEAVVLAGDGQLISQWGGYLEAADVVPTMIVGVHRSEAEDEMVRIREYSPSFDEARFAAHERFVIDEVGEWIRSDLGVVTPVERTAVCGVSAGGELSLALGLRHPDVFGAVFSASPGGGYRPPEVMPDRLPRVYLLAGTAEPFFAENAARWADALLHAGADVRTRTRTGDHGDPFWAEELPLMVAWAFGR
ncbi:alpha/beta hydrolase [Brachybacterium hainanense]|uniref:Alpha/beta hydrolase n=1 Tax=Brachybacterium hainanense TaxID=1541174 RepID=A0ABV6RB99_9MICO